MTVSIYKKVIVFCVLFSSTLNVSSFATSNGSFENSMNLFYKSDSWGFVGKKFYDDPKKSYDKFHKKFLRGMLMIVGVVGGAAGVGYLGYKGGTLLKGKYNALQHYSMSEGCAFVGGMSGSVLGFLALYKSVAIFMRKKADRIALKSFLRNWSENKKLTPPALYSVFDSFANELNRNGWNSISSHTVEITKEVRKQLASNDGRYRKLYETEQDFFNVRYMSFNVSLDIVNLLKLVWDIFRDTRGERQSN